VPLQHGHGQEDCDPRLRIQKGHGRHSRYGSCDPRQVFPSGERAYLHLRPKGPGQADLAGYHRGMASSSSSSSLFWLFLPHAERGFNSRESLATSRRLRSRSRLPILRSRRAEEPRESSSRPNGTSSNRSTGRSSTTRAPSPPLCLTVVWSSTRPSSRRLASRSRPLERATRSARFSLLYFYGHWMAGFPLFYTFLFLGVIVRFVFTTRGGDI
jgi:hypothetical protein